MCFLCMFDLNCDDSARANIKIARASVQPMILISPS